MPSKSLILLATNDLVIGLICGAEDVADRGGVGLQILVGGIETEGTGTDMETAATDLDVITDSLDTDTDVTFN